MDIGDGLLSAVRSHLQGMEGGMKAKEYQIIERCIEDGIRRGWTRAHKHTETPSSTHIGEEIFSAIMLEISEWFTFPEDIGGGHDPG